MIESIINLDQTLFIFINHLPHNLFFDTIFAFFSGVSKWGIVWFAIGLFLLVWEEIKDKKGLIALLVAGFVVFVTNEIVLKYLVLRARPEFTLENVIVVIDKSTSPSFPSGHAAMAFAAAYILAKEHKKWTRWYFLLAFLIAFSRIYLGKHYPIDIVAGTIFGLLIGYLSLKLVTVVLIREYQKSNIKNLSQRLIRLWRKKHRSKIKNNQKI